MKLKFLKVAGMASLMAAQAFAGTVLVNFETVPVLPTGPATFGHPPQNITVPGVATFSGGTILGFASAFPAIVFATPPNVYGTALGYLETITISVDPSFSANEISFPIFNGETFAQSYVANAFNGVTQVATQTLLNLPSNNDSGFGLVDLKAPVITSVTISPTFNPSAFDFLIDSVAFNESVQSAFSPEPGSFFLIGGGLAGLAAFGRRRLKK